MSSPRRRHSNPVPKDSPGPSAPSAAAAGPAREARGCPRAARSAAQVERAPVSTPRRQWTCRLQCSRSTLGAPARAQAGRLLREGLHANTSLTALDLRLNQISVDTVAAIEDVCKKNKVDAQRARREYMEAVRLQETGA